MNIYACLNEITLYIDEHLEERIDYEVLARMMAVNSYTMQKLFSIITGISLSEYIRKRRLTEAGFDILNKGEKIIDVAIKYNYDSATAFSRAFTSFHGIKPSQLKNVSKLKSFPRMVFDENIKIVSELEYEIVNLDEIVLYGLKKETDNIRIKNDAPKFFHETEDKYMDIYGEADYGMVTYENELRESCNAYYVLYKKVIPEFEKVVIPQSKWLRFRINSYSSKEIHDLSQRFYKEFMMSCRYCLRDLPELEYYHDGITDFLIAIE